MKKILLLSLTIIIVSLSIFHQVKVTSEEIFKGIEGSLNSERCEILYSVDNSSYNILSLFEENDNLQQRVIDNKYENIANVLISKEVIEKLCKEHLVESIDDICLLYGQPVWCNDNYLIFDGWPINQNSFYLFDLLNNCQINIDKEDLNEILISVDENEKGIQLYTDHQIYKIQNNLINIIQYNFNQNIELGVNVNSKCHKSPI